MCQRSEELMDLSMDSSSDAKHNIALQTNDKAIEPPFDSDAEANSETNGKHCPVALSPSSIILSPCSENETTKINIHIADEEYDEVKRFFDKKLHVIEKWLRERASPDIRRKLSETINDISLRSPRALRTASVTSDLFQQWLASSPMQVCLVDKEYFSRSVR